MNSFKKNFIKNGIAVPVIIAVIMTGLFFAVTLSALKNNISDILDFSVAVQYSDNAEAADKIEADGDYISERRYLSFSDNTIIGTADITGSKLPVILSADLANAPGKLNLSDSAYIGAVGCAYLECFKSDSSLVKALSVGSKIDFELCYGNYEFEITKVCTLNKNEIAKAALGTDRAVVIYTDNLDGVGISDEYFAAVGKMVSGKPVAQ